MHIGHVSGKMISVGPIVKTTGSSLVEVRELASEVLSFGGCTCELCRTQDTERAKALELPQE